MFLGIFDLDEYVPIPAPTHRFSSGAAYQPTSLTYSIYDAGNSEPIVEDADMVPTSPFDSITGCYLSRRHLTTDAGFERNKTYLVVVKATVDSVPAIDMHFFQIRAKAAAVGEPMTLTPAYDAAKYAASAGAQMNLIDAPNAAAVAAIQSGLATGTNVSDAQTAIISATSDLDTQLDNILNEISYIGIGSGPTAKEYYVYVDNLPCADVLVVMTTDSLGINKIHRGYTDASGLVTFYPDLSVGTTVYMWCYKTGVDFTNPDTEVI